jgi:hypothetical protein
MDGIVAVIEDAAPDVAGQITFEQISLPHPPTIDRRCLDQALGRPQYTHLREGVSQTIELFRDASRAGRIDVERVLA